MPQKQPPAITAVCWPGEVAKDSSTAGFGRAVGLSLATTLLLMKITATAASTQPANVIRRIDLLIVSFYSPHTIRVPSGGKVPVAHREQPAAFGIAAVMSSTSAGEIRIANSGLSRQRSILAGSTRLPAP